MGLSLRTDIAAMNAYRNLSATQDSLNQSLQRLSSGYRINSAADDAAGLAISEGLRSQIGGLTQAVRNTQDGASVVQTAEGALNETTSILQRMRDLSVQASSSGSLNDDAKASIQKEMTQLKSELTRISDTTTFNGTKLLDGSYSGTFQIGANAGETISVNIGKAISAAGLGVDGVDVTGVGNYTNAAASGAGAVVTSNATSGTAATLTFNAATGDDFSTASGTVASFKDLNGQISFGGQTFDLGSVDYSSATGAATALTDLNDAADNALGLASGTAMFAASGSDLVFTAPANVSGYTGAAGVALNDSTTGGTTAATIAAATPTFNGASGASNAITAIDNAIQEVSSQRADLGAIQNRFDHTINNLNTAIDDNTTASESRIRDADMASEMTTFTRAQVLQQAGTATLAQANQSTRSILKLLG